MTDKQTDPNKDHEGDPFDRFEDVLKRILSVPKSEIDKKAAKPQH
jgi:hypothetical protein